MNPTVKVTRVVSLPAVDRQVTLRQYVEGVRRAKANPDARFKHGLTSWWESTGAEIVRQFRRALHERITGPLPEWRKLAPGYQLALRRDCERVRRRVTGRLIVRQFETPEIRRRFGHLLTTDDE